MTSPDPISDDSWTTRLEPAVNAVRLWEARYAEPELPEPGSSLAGDDLVFPALPTSTVVWHSMTSAIDHLGLASDVLQAETVTARRPVAFFSLTRAALLGASQALWVLSGLEEQRAIRSLLIVEDEAALQRKYLNEYLNDPTFSDDVKPELVTQSRELVDRLDERITSVRSALADRGHKGRFQSTTMIRDVAAQMAPTEPWLRRAILDQWMRGSAAAHARMWTMHFAESDDTPLPAGGVIRRITTTAKDIFQAFGAPTLILTEALESWETSRRAPVQRLVPLARIPLAAPDHR